MELIVYTGGTFDVLHAGHVNFLRHCKKLGRVIVSLNTDEFINEFKHNRPLYSYEERKRNLLSLDYVDEVIANSEGRDSKPTVLRVKPDIIMVGSDWALKDYYKQMSFTQEWLDENGITLLYTPYYKGISTTDIKNRVISWYNKKDEGTI